MESRQITAIVLGVGLLLAAPALGAYDETWDNPGLENNEWAYWDLQYGTVPHCHNPMNHFAGGGVNGSGQVQAPLAEMDPAEFHSYWAFWPAYPGENFATQPFPDIDLSIPGAAISVYVMGLHNPIDPPVSLAGGQLRFFIGYWDGKDTEETDDDEQAFFCTDGTFDVGDNGWIETTVVLGDNDDWMTIVKEEDPPHDTQPTDLYVNPQQWGFTIFPVPPLSQPSGGSLCFDEFHLIPEPSVLALVVLGALTRRRRRA